MVCVFRTKDGLLYVTSVYRFVEAIRPTMSDGVFCHFDVRPKKLSAAFGSADSFFQCGKTRGVKDSS